MVIIDRTYALNEVHDLAKVIIQACQNSKIFIFEGDLGAGKTTLIKSLCHAWGYKDEVTSPTFSIINEYPINGGFLYHMDLYRIQDIQELYDIGFEDYLLSSQYCLIEWPQIAEELLIDQKYKIQLSVLNENLRRIAIYFDE